MIVQGAVQGQWVCVLRNVYVSDSPGILCALQTVSYARFLLPTNALVRQKSSGPPDISTAQTPMSRNRINGQKNFTPSRINSTVIQDTGMLHVQIHYVLIKTFLCLFIGDFYPKC